MLVQVLAVVMILVGSGMDVRAQDTEKKFGDAAFLRYEGAQSWPTGNRAQIIGGFAVPIYLGLPERPYRVLGRIYDDRTTGIGLVGRALAEGLFSERDRQRDCADQAKFRGGDAVLVTNDDRVITALGLSREELARTTPLFQHRDSVILVIKFD